MMPSKRSSLYSPFSPLRRIPLFVLALLLALPVVLAAGCREVDNVVYSDLRGIDPEGWDPVESLEFSPFPADSSTAFNYRYDVSVIIRYNRNCANSSLPMIIEQSAEDDVTRRDTLVMPLFNENGVPEGSGELGVYEMKAVVFRNMPLKKDYKVILYSLLNKESSKGILNAGVALKRSKT